MLYIKRLTEIIFFYGISSIPFYGHTFNRAVHFELLSEFKGVKLLISLNFTLPKPKIIEISSQSVSVDPRTRVKIYRISAHLVTHISTQCRCRPFPIRNSFMVFHSLGNVRHIYCRYLICCKHIIWIIIHHPVNFLITNIWQMLQ